jgi:hypothetical protein
VPTPPAPPAPPVPIAPPVAVDASDDALQNPDVHCEAAASSLQSLLAMHGTAQTCDESPAQVGLTVEVSKQLALVVIVVHDERSVHVFVQSS